MRVLDRRPVMADEIVLNCFIGDYLLDLHAVSAPEKAARTLGGSIGTEQQRCGGCDCRKIILYHSTANIKIFEYFCRNALAYE